MTSTKIVIPYFIPKSDIKGEGPYVAIMDITPAIAKYILEHYNKDNRPLTRSTVLFYVKQMQQGKWIGLNGTTIKFGLNGDLVDAQHRLTAIVESGITIKTIVVIGVPEGSFMTLDTGKARSGSDALAIMGYENYTLLASTASFLINWYNGKHLSSANRATGVGGGKMDNKDIVDFVDRNSTKLEKYCKIAQKNYNLGDKLVTPTWLAGLLFVFSKYEFNLAEKFIYELATGSGVKVKEPLYILRQKLQRNKAFEDKKISTHFRLAYIIKTWNAIRTGKQMKVLSYKPATKDSPGKNERFPNPL